MIHNWEQFNEALSNRRIVFEMTGSPRDDMQMLPRGKRTKAVFAEELGKHGYIHGRLNKDCDLLIAEAKDLDTIKMQKAEQYGCSVTTYAALIKKHKLFKDYED